MLAELDSVWEAGKAAAEAGQPRSDNPYDRRTGQGRSWNAGWVSAGGAQEPVRKEPVGYYMAKESFVTMYNGEPVQVAAGDLVHPDHPILKGREALFEPARGHIRFDVEQATAAPGEKRGA